MQNAYLELERWLASPSLTEKEREYQLKVAGEEQANKLLAKLIEAGITVITFDLREPSLHEIFVEKVGEVNE